MKVATSEKWRKANKPVKTVLGLNPWLLVIYIFAVFGAKYAVKTSFCIATFLTIFFGVVEYKGVPALMALRWMRTRLSGRKKRLCPRWVKL